MFADFHLPYAWRRDNQRYDRKAPRWKSPGYVYIYGTHSDPRTWNGQRRNSPRFYNHRTHQEPPSAWRGEQNSQWNYPGNIHNHGSLREPPTVNRQGRHSIRFYIHNQASAGGFQDKYFYNFHNPNRGNHRGNHSWGRQQEAQGFNEYQPKRPSRYSPNTSDLEGSWCIIKNRRTARPQRRFSGTEGPPGMSNRFICLDMEDEPSFQTQEFEPYGLNHPNSSLYDYQRKERESYTDWGKYKRNPKNPTLENPTWESVVPKLGWEGGDRLIQKNNQTGEVAGKMGEGGDRLSPVKTPEIRPEDPQVSTTESLYDVFANQLHPPNVRSLAQERAESYPSYPPQKERSKIITWADTLKSGKASLTGVHTQHQDPIAPIQSTSSLKSLSLEEHPRLGSVNSPRGDLLDERDTIHIKDSQKLNFFAQGFDRIKIESKLFQFAVSNKEIIIVEIKDSLLSKINFRSDLSPHIIQFISEISNANCNQRRKFGHITVSSESNKAGGFLKIAKERGSFIHAPMGPKKSNLFKFIKFFSNFVGLQKSLQDDLISFQRSSPTFEVEESTSISKLIFNSQIQESTTGNQQVHSPTRQPQLSPIQAYSGVSDGFDHSDDSFFSDDFLGHATESDRRPPISIQEEIRKSEFNKAICRKASFVTSENYLPIENLNTQLKIYRKSQKNKRRHNMSTRSQTRDFP
ncbi:unnamed protein product [Cuscuta europaea]|uniref:Uncharacterized protein n=1 Tax=Cuscuta europaea TaxID=41803 RepID=A0A9P1ECE9_CUSEU|nr:unnamed protein product [Cuscuta europaea]